MNHPKSMAPSDRKFFYGYIIVLAAFVIQIAMLGPRASYGVFFKPMTSDLHWARALTSGAFSASQVMQGISGVLMGGLNDRLGPRKVITICGVLVGAGMMLMATIDSAWELYLFYSLVIGIGMGGLVAPQFSTVARWFVKRRTVMTGALVAGGGGGMLVMPLLADWLIANGLFLDSGWRNAWVVLGGIVMVFTVVLAQLLKRDPAQMGLAPLGYDEPQAQQLTSDEGFSVKQAAHTGQFWMLLVMMFSWGTGASTVMVHYVPFITDLGIPASTAATVFSAMGGSVIAGSVIMGTFANKVGVKPAVMVAFGIMAVSLFSLLAVKELWLLYLLAFAFGLTFGGLTPSQSTLVAEMFGLREHGLLLGISSFSVLIGASGGPFLAGYLFDRDGSYSRAFIILGIVVAVGLLFAALLKPPRRSLVAQDSK